MQYLAAYTLASLSGKQPTKEQLSSILKATGQSFDEAEITKVVGSLKGKKIEDLIKAGSSKVGSSSSSAPKAAEKPAAKKQEPKKQVKKEEPKVEQEEEFGGADLFGGDF